MVWVTLIERKIQNNRKEDGDDWDWVEFIGRLETERVMVKMIITRYKQK